MTGGKPSRNLAVPIVERGCRAGQVRGGKKSICREEASHMGRCRG